MTANTPLRIGELARRTGVREHLLRYYEAQGLLAPARSASRYREYAESDVVVVRRIRTLLAAGLSTRSIAQALPCLGELDDRLTPCAGLVADLRNERARIDAQIEQCQTSRQLLDAIIAAGPDAAPAGGSGDEGTNDAAGAPGPT